LRERMSPSSNIFDHMLLAELLAFLMTSLSAFVEWATLARRIPRVQ